MEMLKSLWNGLIGLGIFIAFGLPILITIIVFYYNMITEPDGFLSFRGRLNRKAYIRHTIIAYLISLFFVVLFVYFLSIKFAVLSVLFLILLIFSITYIWAITARRFHDLNISGWFAALQFSLMFIANVFDLSSFQLIIAIIFSVPLWCLKGTIGTNKYGQDPLIEQ